jgi:very-short-patch-repair endonuclease
MQEAGPALQQIKPVLLMSPISVAQFLRPGVIEFDLLVIDEASQVRPEDALGAVARVKQIVVVGDSKQLPPTSFFDRMMSDEIAEREPEDEDEIPAPTPPGAAELESVLTLCNARGLNEEMLRWHYRSRHPSLIEVSNETFYGGSLILPPAPVSEKTQTGLFINRVSGAYDRGGKRNNRIEADNVVKAVAVHARKYPEQSLGVVTFSTAQRDLITELLELARRDDPQLDIFLREGMQEDFFVKNLENVQGDERDVIMISIGYGPRIAGTPLDSMAFGPVSREGGERRLNVLFTRARDRTEVFASFDPGDINLARTKMEGARILKRYLQYAESGVLHVHESTGKDPDSDFEISVANAVRGMGYDVDYQIGSAGFRIDLAVHNPAEHGKYLLAVECDGATYHSALWARERDRLRQEVLEGMGWAFHRVWSTDWFHRRNEEIERLRQALLKAQETNLTKAPGANVGSGPKIEEQDLETPVDVGIEVEPTSVESIDQAELSPAPSALPPYELADFDNSHICEPHELEVGKMADFVQKIIDVEGPVHEEEISRRVASLFGKLRTGARISDSTVNALRHMGANQADYFNENRFWGTKRQFADPPLRNRSDAPQTLRRADMLPPPEIAAAIRRTLEENGGLAETDIPRAVALLFGFLRTGPEFKPAIEPVIARLKAEGAITEAPSGLIVNGIL